jgi:hypothetical protein
MHVGFYCRVRRSSRIFLSIYVSMHYEHEYDEEKNKCNRTVLFVCKFYNTTTITCNLLDSSPTAVEPDEDRSSSHRVSHRFYRVSPVVPDRSIVRLAVALPVAFVASKVLRAPF